MAPLTKVGEQVKLPLPFDLNALPEEEEASAKVGGESATSGEPSLPDSESDDNIRPSTLTVNVPPVDASENNHVQDTASAVVEGPRTVDRRRKRKGVEGSEEGSSRGEMALPLRMDSKKEIIVDDGYRWRKYGEKIINGYIYPRAYYRCSSAGCMVKRHVERDSFNINNVIISYEGRHNHEKPPPKKPKWSLSNFGLHGTANTPNPPAQPQPQLHPTLQLLNNHLKNPELASTKTFLWRNDHFGTLRYNMMNMMNIGGSSSNNAPRMNFNPSIGFSQVAPQPFPSVFQKFPTSAPLFNHVPSSAVGEFSHQAWFDNNNGNGSSSVFPWKTGARDRY